MFDITTGIPLSKKPYRQRFPDAFVKPVQRPGETFESLFKLFH